MNNRTFTFVAESFDDVTRTQLEEMQGIISVEDKPLVVAGMPTSGSTIVTITFDPSMLMEVADDLSSLGFTEAEQNIFEENYDIYSEE